MVRHVLFEAFKYCGNSGFVVGDAALMERLVIDWLRAASQKAVGEQLGLSWDEIHGIMERAVERGLERRQAEPLPQLGVDEKAFREGHKYFTVVIDLERSHELFVEAEDLQI